MTQNRRMAATRSATFRTAPWYSWTTAFPRALITPRWANAYVRRLGVRRLKDLSTHSWKRGETAFIMGSGPSINELSEQQWQVIGSGTTVGVNWWTEHDFVPDLYVFENLSERHRQMLIARSDDYMNTPMILKQFLTNFSPAVHRQRMEQLALLPQDVRSRIHLCSDLLIPGRTEKELRRAYRNVERLGLFQPRERFQWVVKRTSSLTFLIALCLRAGFEQIVLCGVDLDRPGTFYEPEPAVVSGRSLHETQDPSVKVLPIVEVVRLLDEEVLKGRSARLFVASRRSLLANHLPVYGW